MSQPFFRGLKAAILGAAIASAGAFAATAASVTVIADVNAQSDQAGNQQLYANILGDSTNVIFSRSQEQQAATRSFFNSQAGVTATENAGTLTDALLASVDLLVITRFFNNAVDYTAAELTAISNFVSGGGDLLLVLESSANSANFAGYNGILSAIGSSISYTGGRTVAIVDDQMLENTDISDNSMTFQCDACAHLSGGDAVADVNGPIFVAYENLGPDMPAVPLPGTLPLMAAGAIALAGVARKRRKS